MIRRNLMQRLSRPEEKTMPAGEPKVIEVVFIRPDGTQAPGGLTLTIPFYPSNTPGSVERPRVERGSERD